jgi:hypothetical protein
MEIKINKILIIGRCWKFLDFLIPTVDSILNYNDNVDLIIIDNFSSRSDNIKSYCNRLLKSKDILAFISMDNNYYGNVWNINKYLINIFEKYEYICMTDLDLKLINPQHNWINKLTDILDRNPGIGAVSCDVEPMPPFSNGFEFSMYHPELKFENENFWKINTDGCFYTVRKNEFLKFLQSDLDIQFGPGMHGYNEFCDTIGKSYGRTDIIFYHYGWLRSDSEWNRAYEETGINFNVENLNSNNYEYCDKQGKNCIAPTENSFTITWR